MKMILFHSAPLSVAVAIDNTEYIMHLYEEVKNMPATTTIQKLKMEHGISLNGPLKIGEGKFIRGVDTLTGI